MDGLEAALSIQRQSLNVIRNEYLDPMTSRLRQKPQVTLAEWTQANRLETLCDLWEEEFPMETNVLQWYKSKQGTLTRDLLHLLHEPAERINQESGHLNRFLCNTSMPFEEAIVTIEAKLEADLKRRTVDKRNKFKNAKTAGAIYESMHRQDSDSEDEPDEDEPMPNPIELKIATLHESLEQILLATRELIEKIQRSGENMTSSNKIFVRDLDVSKLLLRFPEKYILRTKS